MVQLPDMGLSSAVNGINDIGQAAGWVLNASFRRRPVVWNNASSFVSLPLLPGADEGEPLAINLQGTIVGVTPGKGATLWTDGQAYILNDLVSPPSSFKLTRARAINDLGWIAGSGFLGSEETGFLLIPIPEPGAAFLAALALATLIVSSRSRH
jgi:hypothetical protein